jgi:hypothetical protein
VINAFVLVVLKVLDLGHIGICCQLICLSILGFELSLNFLSGLKFVDQCLIIIAKARVNDVECLGLVTIVVLCLIDVL